MSAHTSLAVDAGAGAGAGEAPVRHRLSEEIPRPVTRPSRPTHIRSRSYLSSPVETKPRNAVTDPVVPASAAGQSKTGLKDDEPSVTLFPRIHLPGHRTRHSNDVRDGVGFGAGKHQQHSALHPYRGHRHTQSEVRAPSRPRSSSNLRDGDTMDRLEVPGAKANMLTRMASNLSSRTGGSHKPQHQHSNSDLTKALPLSRPDLRRRATSDPRTPSQRFRSMQDNSSTPQFKMDHRLAAPAPPQPAKPLTEVESLLLRAEKRKHLGDLNVSESDVQVLSTQLAESNVEIQSHLSTSTRTASDLMRRLDDAQDALLHAATSLTDTISSFHDLNTQSEALVANFGSKTLNLDETFKKQLKKSQYSLFEERGSRVTQLEKRGQAASNKAQALSQRLENCRVILTNFEERELKKRRARRDVIAGLLWGAAMILLGIFLGFSLWWWRSYSDVVRYDVHEAVALLLDHSGSHKDPVKVRLLDSMKEERGNNKTAQEVFQNLPVDIKAVLDDIAKKHGVGEDGSVAKDSGQKLQYKPVGRDNEAEIEEKHLKKLFEKLEL